MVTIVDNGNRPTACILSEAGGRRSRENIVIVAGSGIIAPNTVLGLITSGTGQGKYKPSPLAAETPDIGNQTAVAIALYGGDATTADIKVAALRRDAEVNGKTLIYAPSVTTAAHRTTKNAQLATAGIIVR